MYFVNKNAGGRFFELLIQILKHEKQENIHGVSIGDLCYYSNVIVCGAPLLHGTSLSHAEILCASSSQAPATRS
ncbi:MAG: hypothetical protein ABUT20_21965 [Bacteroidota bacterium]